MFPEPNNTPSRSLRQASAPMYARHPRTWRDFHYVYPVVSRRSKGLSIGINLNIDKACNFDCVYCCVNRNVPSIRRDIDLAQIRAELDRMLTLATSGAIWQEEPFNLARPEQRRINDIAFSGDGEPTTYRRFDEACRIAAELKAAHGLGDVKLVVITNATGLNRAPVRRALAILDANRGEIWAKLDAGTEAYYRQIDRTKIPFCRVLDHILACGRERDLVIQSLFIRLAGQPISKEEFAAFCQRLGELRAGGCRIKLVQLYTVARPTAEHNVTALTDGELDDMAADLRRRQPDLPVEVYYGVG